MKRRNSIWAILAQLVLIGGFHLATAQQMPGQTPTEVEVSDSELKNFVEISGDIRGQQQATQVKMVEIIEGSDLGKETFTQIAQSYQSGGSPDEEFTESDMMAFQEVNAQLQPLQIEAQQNAMKTIAASDMDVQRFQEIAQALQSDQELQQRYMTLVQESMGE